jgi:hypothetical protein
VGAQLGTDRMRELFSVLATRTRPKELKRSVPSIIQSAAIFMALPFAIVPAYPKDGGKSEALVQKSTPCWQPSILDRGKQSVMPVGCIDIASAKWTLSAEKLIEEGNESTGGCDTMDVTFIYNQTAPKPQSPLVPNCHTTRSTSGGATRFGATIGLASLEHYQLASHLVQTVTKHDGSRQESALVVNFVSKTGAGPKDKTHGDFSEKVGFYNSTLVMPGAGPTWTENPILVVLEGVGKENFYLREADLTNFNGPIPPGGQRGNIVGDFRNFHGHPVTAAVSYGSSVAYPRENPGKVRVTTKAGSTAILFANADARSVLSAANKLTCPNIPPWTYVESIDGDPGKMNAKSGAAVLTAPAVANSTQVCDVTDFSMFIGESLAGSTLIRDSIWNEGTNSQYVLRTFGEHQTIIDTTVGKTDYFWTGKSGQKLCFLGQDACLQHDGGILQYSQNGGRPLEVAAAKGGANGLRVSSATPGFGPSLQPAGPDANIPLNLYGKGASPVQVQSGLTVASSISAPNLPASAGPFKGSLCVDTGGNIVVKTTPGPCL